MKIDEMQVNLRINMKDRKVISMNLILDKPFTESDAHSIAEVFSELGIDYQNTPQAPIYQECSLYDYNSKTKIGASTYASLSHRS